MRVLNPDDPAEVLEAAADALEVYGRCRGTGVTDDGAMCVRGAIAYVEGRDPADTAEVMGTYGKPTVIALEAYLAAHPEVLGDLAEKHPDWVERGPFPSWAWNDHKYEEDDAEVTDTLRRCAKSIRNGEAG